MHIDAAVKRLEFPPQHLADQVFALHHLAGAVSMRTGTVE
jgi:hypothetical protein